MNAENAAVSGRIRSGAEGSNLLDADPLAGTSREQAEMNYTHDQHSQCARCGAPIPIDLKDPSNWAMRVCDPCAVDIGEEVGQ